MPWAGTHIRRFRLLKSRSGPGDRLLFYTDGVNERFNEQQELYGTSRLLRQLETADTDDPATILEGIVDDLSRFAGTRPADDDQAMLVIVAE